MSYAAPMVEAALPMCREDALSAADIHISMDCWAKETVKNTLDRMVAAGQAHRIEREHPNGIIHAYYRAA